jgi:hypothetical protein
MNLLTENHESPFNLLVIYVWTHDTISIYTHIAHSKENFLTVKKNCSQKSNLLRARICSKIAHSRNMRTDLACSIEKLLTMKNLAGLDGSTQWLNVLQKANQRTAGARHSTVSLVTAGTCWAGPSRSILSTIILCTKLRELCVLVNLFFGRIAASSGDKSSACSHVFYPVSELAIFRQSACRKRQLLVGNKKCLSETTKLYRQVYP